MQTVRFELFGGASPNSKIAKKSRGLPSMTGIVDGIENETGDALVVSSVARPSPVPLACNAIAGQLPADSVVAPCKLVTFGVGRADERRRASGDFCRDKSGAVTFVGASFEATEAADSSRVNEGCALFASLELELEQPVHGKHEHRSPEQRFQLHRYPSRLDPKTHRPQQKPSCSKKRVNTPSATRRRASYEHAKAFHPHSRPSPRLCRLNRDRLHDGGQTTFGRRDQMSVGCGSAVVWCPITPRG